MEEITKLQQEIERIKKWNRWFYGRVKYMRECQKMFYDIGYKLKKADSMQAPGLQQQRIECLKKATAIEQEIDAEIRRIETKLIEKHEAVQMLIETFGAEPVPTNGQQP